MTKSQFKHLPLAQVDEQRVANLSRFTARNAARAVARPLVERIDKTDAEMEDFDRRLIALGLRLRAVEQKAHEHWWTRLDRWIRRQAGRMAA